MNRLVVINHAIDIFREGLFELAATDNYNNISKRFHRRLMYVSEHNNIIGVPLPGWTTLAMGIKVITLSDEMNYPCGR